MKTSVLIKTALFVSIIFASQQTTFAQLTCQDAEPIDYTGPDIQAVFTFTTVGVPNDNATSLAPTCNTTVGTGGQHWYSLSLENTETIPVSITTDLPQTNFDTKLHVYTGQCGMLTCVAGDDDSGTGTTSTVLFNAEPNTTYLIRVGGFNIAAGITAISLDAGLGGCTDQTASNYYSWYTWDDGSCCYSGLLELSPDAPINSVATLFVNFQPVGSAYPGSPLSFCIDKTCGSFLTFDGWNGPGAVTATYTLTTNGEVFTGTPPISYWYSVINFEPSYCGCLDPEANNYSPIAYISNDQCYYVNNVSCDSAILLEPNKIVLADNTNVPLSGQDATTCYATYGVQIVWYKFVYNGGMVRISTPFGTFDTVLSVYDDCDGNILTCIDDALIPYSNSNNLFFDTKANVTYDCEDGLIKGHTYYVGIGLLGNEAEFPVMFEEYQSTGCTDPLAVNYNSCASIDDGSCVMESCPADLDNSGYVNIADLLQFVSAYGSSCSN